MNRDGRGTGDRYGNDEIPPKLYDILTGTVASIQAYGAFIKFPGRRKNGLVHRSQISKMPVENPAEVLEMGEEVRVKVISHGDDGTKIALSMKCVNQSTGEDLDPGHVQVAMDEQRRKTGFKKGAPRIELGAVLNTTCKKCGGKGHFTQECFQKSGEKASYNLLPEIDDMVEQEREAAGQSGSAKKKKKDKKHKKKKKHRKKEAHSESESEDEHKAKKLKKHKHKRLRKESLDDSSSGSASDSPRRRHKLDDSSHGAKSHGDRSRDERPRDGRTHSEKPRGDKSHDRSQYDASQDQSHGKPYSKSYDRHGGDRCSDRHDHGSPQDRSRDRSSDKRRYSDLSRR